MRGAVPIGFLLALALPCIAATAPVVIPVVHTWADLHNAPKLTFTPSHPTDSRPLPPATPVTFQVGISDAKTADQGAIVLYFLGSTGAPSPYTPEEWGVYWLQIDGQPWGRNTNTLTYQKIAQPPGTLFYAETIPSLAPGDHVIELIKPFDINSHPALNKEALARCTIHVPDSPGDLWYPLWTIQDSSGGALSDRNADGSRYAMEPVMNPKGGPAVPSTPRPNWYTGFPAPGQALPALVPPADTVPSAHLKMTGSTLIVTFTPKIEGFFPDDYFLTRWWVNGQPAHLDPKARRPGQMRFLGANPRSDVPPSGPVRFLKASFFLSNQLALDEIGAQVWYTQDVRFDLHFKPEWLGAKKGDRIGVQFLYCPHGFLSQDMEADFFHEPESPAGQWLESSFSQLSNQLEFTYSGDPDHPQF